MRKTMLSLLFVPMIVAGQTLIQKDEKRFSPMTDAEIRAYEMEVMGKIADLALIPPKVNTNPLPAYDYDRLRFGMNAGIARTPGGRLWANWVAGADGPAAFVLLNRSDDDGETWSKPCLVIDAQSPGRLPMSRPVMNGNIWTDPNGKLRLYFYQTMQLEGGGGSDQRGGAWEVICENPDDARPLWGKPRRIWHGVPLNKPIVLTTGEWLLPVWLVHPYGGRFRDVFKALDPVRGANAICSADQGVTWQRAGGLMFPNPECDEHMFVERKDGTVWMLTRTRTGIMQSFSPDRGKTWSEPSEPPGIRAPVSRFYIGKLASGRILFVKHGDTVDTHEGRRNKLKAFLSEDEGLTWKGGLMLDGRDGVSYPDGFQAPDGTIYVTYDRNRSTDGEILLARFTEQDVLEGKLTGSKSKLRMLVCRPLKNPDPAKK